MKNTLVMLLSLFRRCAETDNLCEGDAGTALFSVNQISLFKTQFDVFDVLEIGNRISV